MVPRRRCPAAPGCAGGTTIPRPSSRTTTWSRRTARRSKVRAGVRAASTPGVFDDDRYWIVEVHYAKADADGHPDADRRPQSGARRRRRCTSCRRCGSATSGPGTPTAAKPTLTAAADGTAGSRPGTGELGDYTLDVGPAPTAAGRPCCSARTRRTSSGSTARPADTPYPKDGINDHVVVGAPTVNPDGTGTKAAAWYQVTVAAGGVGRDPPPAAGSPTGARAGRGDAGAGESLAPDFEATMRQREAEADEFYADLRREGATDDERTGSCARRSPACSGASSTTATTWPAGSTATPAAAPAARARAAAATRLAALRRGRHHVDARSLGVPVVRRLGPRLPRDHAGPRRSGLRQVPAARAVPRVVPAPQRGAARLRVVVRRRQPAGPRRGRATSCGRSTDGATRTSSSGSSTSCCSTSRGGSTARTQEGNDLFSGGFLGLDNIGAFDRSHLPRRCRARAVRCDGLDVPVLHLDAAHRDRAGRDGPGLRGPR